jgi:hypothetical protein
VTHAALLGLFLLTSLVLPTGANFFTRRFAFPVNPVLLRVIKSNKEKEIVVVVVVGKIGITAKNARNDAGFRRERMWTTYPHNHNRGDLSAPRTL